MTNSIIAVCNGDNRKLSQRRKALWSGRFKQCDVNYIIAVCVIVSTRVLVLADCFSFL